MAFASRDVEGTIERDTFLSADRIRSILTNTPVPPTRHKTTSGSCCRGSDERSDDCASITGSFEVNVSFRDFGGSERRRPNSRLTAFGWFVRWRYKSSYSVPLFRM